MLASASRRTCGLEKKVPPADFSSQKRKSSAKRSLRKYFLDAKFSASTEVLRGENFLCAKNKKCRGDARDCVGARRGAVKPPSASELAGPRWDVRSAQVGEPAAERGLQLGWTGPVGDRAYGEARASSLARGGRALRAGCGKPAVSTAALWARATAVIDRRYRWAEKKKAPDFRRAPWIGKGLRLA
jgi:hypothetical protein